MHSKISGPRADLLHELERQRVTGNQVIVGEDLVVKSRVKEHHLTHSICQRSRLIVTQ
ncbi:hypothetical protein [Pantanalinema sp. GBBB05]|uniref:hypothetical protein n=1 Tax=Pantanalinema sp. GBBB05 TaxID=2604139 RepID=UPI003D818596